MALTVPLSEKESAALRREAETLGLSVEKLVRQILRAHLDHSRDFQQAAEYVLSKNAELYRRLAKGPTEG